MADSIPTESDHVNTRLDRFICRIIDPDEKTSDLRDEMRRMITTGEFTIRELNRYHLSQKIHCSYRFIRFPGKWSILTAAVASNRCILCLECVTMKFDLTIPDGSAEPAVITACRFKNDFPLTILLRNGVDVEQLNDQNATALFFSVAFRDNEKCIRCLLDHGADKNRMCSYGQAPLSMAIMADNPAAMRILIEYGADVNAVNTFGGSRQLHIAASLMRHECMRVLLEHGADVEMLDRAGETPLIITCKNMDRKGALILLEHGADFARKVNGKNAANTVLGLADDRPNRQLLPEEAEFATALLVMEGDREFGLWALREAIAGRVLN